MITRRGDRATRDSATTRSSRPRAIGGRTFAQMSAEEKHRISHRGRAFRALADLLVAQSGSP